MENSFAVSDIEDKRIIEDKLFQLESLLKPMGRVLIGYSGGVDSAMLAVAAYRVLGKNAICVTADSESYASGELERAKEITSKFDIPHKIIKTRELDNPEYAKNSPDRCYHCKSELFSHMTKIARDLDVNFILYGQNADDVGDFRPGAKAAEETGVRAPLAEVAMTKKDVRILAKRWGLSVWDRPAMACLSSRFPYGIMVTAKGLEQIDRAEAFLKKHIGYNQVRSRHHNDLARIEVPDSDISELLDSPSSRKMLVKAMGEIGYLYSTIDLRGFRSGSMNEALLRISEENHCSLRKYMQSIFHKNNFNSGCYEDRDQLLYLRLSDIDIRRLSEDKLRNQLVLDMEATKFRYIALDLDPLQK